MKKLFTSLILFLGLIFGLSLHGQVVTIGTGTSTQRYPLTPYYGYQRSASLYTAAEINTPGGGNILSVGWEATATMNIAFPVKVYLKSIPTTTTAITAQNWNTLTTGATLVYSANVTSLAVGWNTLQLQLPYNYNGTDNLMVLVETNYGGFGVGSSGNAGAGFKYSTATAGHMYFEINTTAPTGNGTLSAKRPNVRFTFGTPPTCLPMPPGGTLSTGTITATSAVLNWTAYSSVPAGGYDIYYSTMNTAPTAATPPSQNVPSGTTATLSPLTPNTMYYAWVRAKCSATDQSAWSGPITITIPPTCPPMPATGSLSTGTITATSAVLNWTAFGYVPAGGYDIYYGTGNTAPTAATPPSQNVPSGTTATLSPLTPNTAYYAWVRARCSTTDQSAWKGPISFYTGYCVPTGGTSSTSYYLNNITTTGGVANLNYTANNYTAYVNNSATAVSAIASTSVNVNLAAAGNNTYHYYIWVDWNNDMNFNGAGETILATTNYSTTATGTIPIAAGQVPGNYRVRMATSESETITACGTVSAGNYVDFTLSVIALQPCSAAPPTNITVSNLIANSAVVSWIPTTGTTYTLRYKKVTDVTWTTINITTPLTSSQLLSNLVDQTQYEFQIATICGGTQGAFSSSVNFTTPALSYCNSAATSTFFNGYISQVAVNAQGAPSMNSNSNQSGYTDYSTDPTRLVTLVRGGTATVSVAKTWPGYQYGFLTGVWIDFNRNGIFEATERVLTSPSNTTTPVTATFNIPTAAGGAYTGNLTTRMRVVMNEYSPINACGTYSYGETEDYAVKLIDLSACTTAPPSDIQVNNVTPSSANVTWTSTTGATYIVRYRVSPSGAWQQIAVNTPLVSNQILTGLLEQTAYEVQVATICGGTTGAFSPSVNFTTPALTYCTAGPTSNTATSGYINNVTVTPTNTPIMLSNSGSDNYKDYTPDPTRVVIFERGSVNNKISVNKYWPGSPTSYGVSAWVDFNRNGTFETSERILNTTYNTTTPVTATFAVPTVASGNVYTGNLPTRMRVVMRYFDNANPCGTFTQGEVEDYPVKFVDSQPCSTAPPTNITVNNIGATTATVSWVATVGATYNIRWRTTPGGVWQTATVPAGQNFYGITGLTEQTNYEVQVSTTCGGSTGSYSSSVTFTTPPLSYCPMTGTGTNDHISNVTVTSSNLGVPPMNNTSVQTNYTSYTTPETLITLDVDSQNNKISVAKGWTGATGNDAVTAWIDFDRNGQFTDAERILISPANTTTPVTATFAVPSTSYTGPLTTTMRVVLKRTSAPVMCQNAVDGEVEDYRVRIRPCSNATPNAPTFTTTHTTATVTITGAGVSYVVRYRVQGTTAWTQVYASTQLGNLPLVITGLTPATTYEVEVAAICGDVIGTATPIKTFTTRCDPTPPNVTVGNITPTTALITWAPLAASSTYTMRWRKVGTGPWNTISLPAAPANTYVLGSVTPLEPFTTYEVQIANMCNGETTLNPYSNPKVFTTERICEIPPPGLTITQLLPTSASIQWDPFPGATYVLRYRKVGIPSWTEVPSLVNNLVLTGLTELTKYEMQVVNICNGTPGNYTPPYYFTTPTVIYCQMHSGSSTGEHISKVTVKPTGKKTMENESGASTYTDYTGVPKTFIEMIQGSTDNEIIIEKKWTGNTYNEGIAVWIDFNRNGEFDINERVLSSPPNTDSPISGKFNVPADAFVSMTDYKYVVMRVAMERDGIPVNCTSFKNGEVEDYTVRISKPIVANPIDQTGIMIYPNPVSSILFVKNISKRAKYKIYNAAGQVIADGILLNNQINVSRLINGVYVIDIDDNGKTVQKKFIKE